MPRYYDVSMQDSTSPPFQQDDNGNFTLLAYHGFLKWRSIYDIYNDYVSQILVKKYVNNNKV